MSLPITATGPLNVLMNPILIVFCWATAGPAASRKAALAAKSVLRMCSSPRPFRPVLWMPSCTEIGGYWSTRRHAVGVSIARPAPFDLCPLTRQPAALQSSRPALLRTAGNIVRGIRPLSKALDKTYDGIIIGAGHHGLILGTYL